MKEIKKQRAARLRQIKNGLTDQQFADRLGLAYTTVRKWLIAESSPRDQSVWQSIADSYGVPVNWLLDGRLPTAAEYTRQQLLRLFAADPVIDSITEIGNRVYPVINAYVSEHQTGFFCIHCNSWHYHGREDGDNAPGIGECEQTSRMAHCVVANSPYKTNGYVLRIAGEMPAVVQDLAWPICQKCGKYYSAALGCCACGEQQGVVAGQYVKMAEIYRNIYLLDAGIDQLPLQQDQVRNSNQNGQQFASIFDAAMQSWFETMRKWVMDEYGADNDGAQEFFEQFRRQFPAYSAWLADRRAIKNPAECRS